MLNKSGKYLHFWLSAPNCYSKLSLSTKLVLQVNIVGKPISDRNYSYWYNSSARLIFSFIPWVLRIFKRSFLVNYCQCNKIQNEYSIHRNLIHTIFIYMGHFYCLIEKIKFNQIISISKYKACDLIFLFTYTGYDYTLFFMERK